MVTLQFLRIDAFRFVMHRFSVYRRRRRMALFERLLAPSTATRILDLGGSLRSGPLLVLLFTS